MNTVLKKDANVLKLKLQGMNNQLKNDSKMIDKNRNYILNFEKMISEMILDHIDNYKVFLSILKSFFI